MNEVTLCGKIIRITKFDKVTYVTLHCKDGKNSEYLDVTIFDTTFFDRYFVTGMWIGVSGHIHKNKHKDYQQEIIVERMFFVGDTPSIMQESEPTEFTDINDIQQINDMVQDFFSS